MSSRRSAAAPAAPRWILRNQPDTPADVERMFSRAIDPPTTFGNRDLDPLLAGLVRIDLDPAAVPLLLAVDRRDLRTPNRSVWHIQRRIGTAVRWLDERRDLIVRSFPLFPLRRIDDLRLLGGAIVAVDVGLDVLATGRVRTAEVHAQAVKDRDMLLADVRALVAHDLLPARTLRLVHGGPGYRHVLPDIEVLAYALEEAWPHIEGRTALTLAQLHRVHRTLLDVGEVMGRRRQGEIADIRAAELRARAFVAAVSTYDEVRRAVAPLACTEPTFDDAMPKLFAKMGFARKRKPTPPTPEGA